MRVVRFSHKCVGTNANTAGKSARATLWLRKVCAIVFSIVCANQTLRAQTQSIAPQQPTGLGLIRPYEASKFPPVRLQNSTRLRTLIRAGKLYLTVQDAIALALENNIDIEFDRYNALLAQWNVERAEGGGALPGVPSTSSQVSSVTSGEGVAGTQAAAGVSTSGRSISSTNLLGASITQIGSVTPTLDPVVQAGALVSHLSAPQADSIQSGVTNLVSNTRIYNASISQGIISGGTITLSYKDQYLSENAPSDVLNPQSATTLSFSFRHNLLQGFGVGVNSRTITVNKANLKVNDLNFKTEVMGVVADVLNLYYGLVADYEDVKAKQRAVEVAQRFYEDNKKQLQIGTLAPLDVTTAEAQVASSQLDLVTSQATLQQQQVSLKNLLSRTSTADPLLANADIVALDRIIVPEKDDLPPVKDMVAIANANRPDIEVERLNIINDKTNALNTQNGTLPTLAVLAGGSAQGLAGVQQYYELPPSEQALFPRPLNPSSLPPGFTICPPSKSSTQAVCEVPSQSLVGGIGNALGQMIRRDYPTENVGAYIAPTVRNRPSVADQEIDQLSIRQTELQHAKNISQIAVDVSNQVVGIQQARARYQAAVKNRILEEQLLDAEQKKFRLGASTTFNVVQQQRDLATAQSAEVAALAAYSNARVSLEQTLGTTLRDNNVLVEEAQTGRVARSSVLPAFFPFYR
jgi:outer membrane protein